MDPGLEGRVKGFDAVGSEEENALEVFQETEKDGDQCVAVEIMDAAALEEDVGFVEEEDGAPCVREVEDPRECGFQDTWIGP